MPCYQVQTVSVEFHAKNRELLDKAIKELGWRVSENSARAMVVYPTNSYNALTLDLQTGHAAFADGQQSKLNELKALGRIKRWKRDQKGGAEKTGYETAWSIF